MCQELRVMLYEGSRCTYCGRCADVCPEKAITMTKRYELATGDKNDITERLELFMLTCQRCGRCYDMENSNSIDRMDLRGYRYDNLETRAFIRKATDQFDQKVFKETESYQRPVKL
jgi:hydrogenase-4 component H